MFLLLHLRHPRDFKSTYPEGEPCTSKSVCEVYMGCTFFAHRPAFLFWPRVFSRSLGCGARREPACTQGASLRPGRAPWCVIWALKFARCIPLVEPRRTMETPHFEKILLCCFSSHVCTTRCLKLSSCLLGGSHGTTAVAHRALSPFVTATDGASVCLCVFVPRSLST